MSDYAIRAALMGQDRMSSAFRSAGRGADKFGNSVKGNMRKSKVAVKNFGSVFQGVLGAHLFMGAANQIGRLGMGIVKSISMVEDATAGFIPLMGSVEKATELVSELNKTAATTPFQFQNISDVAKQLLPVMNGDIENTIKTFRMLGDTAGGNAQKLESITRGFTKAMMKGKVDLESLNMIAEAGVPIFDQLASVMGTEVNEAFFKMISAGDITTDALTKTFQKMTSEGGIFFGGMEIASQTLSGLFSTLKDNITLTAAEIGTVFLEELKTGVRIITSLVQKTAAWLKVNKELIKGGFDAMISRFKLLYVSFKQFFSLASEYGPLTTFFNSLNLVFQSIGTYLEKLVGAYKELFSYMGQVGMVKNFLNVLTGAADILVIAFNIVNDAIDILVNFLKKSGVFELITASLKGVGAALKLVGVLAKQLWRIIKPILNGIFNLLAPIIKFFTAIPRMGLNLAGSAIGGIAEGIGSIAQPDENPAALPVAAPNKAAMDAKEVGVFGTIDVNSAPGVETRSRPTRRGRGSNNVQFNDNPMGENG